MSSAHSFLLGYCATFVLAAGIEVPGRRTWWMYGRCRASVFLANIRKYACHLHIRIQTPRTKPVLLDPGRCLPSTRSRTCGCPRSSTLAAERHITLHTKLTAISGESHTQGIRPLDPKLQYLPPTVTSFIHSFHQTCAATRGPHSTAQISSHSNFPPSFIIPGRTISASSSHNQRGRRASILIG